MMGVRPKVVCFWYVRFLIALSCTRQSRAPKEAGQTVQPWEGTQTDGQTDATKYIISLASRLIIILYPKVIMEMKMLAISLVWPLYGKWCDVPRSHASFRIVFCNKVMASYFINSDKKPIDGVCDSICTRPLIRGRSLIITRGGYW